MSTKKTEPWLEQTIALARAFADGAPSDADRDEAIGAIDGMIRELQRIREHLSALPSETERDSVRQAAATMEQFLDSMRARPAVALSMGLGGHKAAYSPRSQKESPHSTTPKALPLARGRDDVDTILAALEQLSTEDIQHRLLDESEFPVSRLQALARKLGLPTDRGRDRLDLVDRIFKLGFANKRGYELLGGPRRAAR